MLLADNHKLVNHVEKYNIEELLLFYSYNNGSNQVYVYTYAQLKKHKSPTITLFLSLWMAIMTI